MTFQNEQHIMAPYLFRAYPQRAMFDQAMALQREGDFGEVCRNIWAESFVAWTTKYGMMDLDCEVLGYPVHLEVSGAELQVEIEEGRRCEGQRGPSWVRQSIWIGKYQDQSNYTYWRTRSRIESEKEMSDAHRLLYEGEQALHKADPTTAIKLYVDGMTKYEQDPRRVSSNEKRGRNHRGGDARRDGLAEGVGIPRRGSSGNIPAEGHLGRTPDAPSHRQVGIRTPASCRAVYRQTHRPLRASQSWAPGLAATSLELYEFVGESCWRSASAVPRPQKMRPRRFL